MHRSYYNLPIMRILLKLLVSLRSAVLLIGVLTALSVIGTIIPQNLEAVEYLRRYPTSGHWFIVLGFDDMYRSLIFQASLWLLSFSTVACIMTRWKSTSRRLWGRISHVSEKEVRAFPCSKKLEKPVVVDLKTIFTSARTDDAGNEILLRTSGKLSLLGGLILHVGFLAVLAGGLIGVFYGVETAIRGGKDEIIPIAPLEAVRAARDADKISREARAIRHFSPEDPRLEEMRKRVDELHAVYAAGVASPAFRLLFDELWVDHYHGPEGEQKGIKSWNSKLRFIRDGVESEPVAIKVNHPVTFGDYTFYQASWNRIFRKIRVKVDLISGQEGMLKDFLAAPASFPLMIELKKHEPVKPDWSMHEFVLHDFLPDFRIINDRFVSVSHELNNPAGRIVAYDAAGNISGRAWAFPDDRVMQPGHVSNMPFLFTFIEAEPEFESGLQMAHDPGKPVVWIGCLLFTIGMILSFYIPYREEWVIRYSDGTVRIAIGGNRPPVVFARNLEYLENMLTYVEQKESQNE